ncbi:TPA: hypothetical protein DCE37_18425 [Candidatus Latescibacteria bacterium]|nr:hypothetical protein [Candidatus Latescibacterota bacterium]
MINVTVVEQDRWTRRALSRLLAQANIAVTTHERWPFAQDGSETDVIVAGATTIGDHLTRTQHAHPNGPAAHPWF